MLGLCGSSRGDEGGVEAGDQLGGESGGSESVDESHSLRLERELKKQGRDRRLTTEGRACEKNGCFSSSATPRLGSRRSSLDGESRLSSGVAGPPVRAADDIELRDPTAVDDDVNDCEMNEMADVDTGERTCANDGCGILFPEDSVGAPMGSLCRTSTCFCCFSCCCCCSCCC